jgi:hypothetical protein
VAVGVDVGVGVAFGVGVGVGVGPDVGVGVGLVGRLGVEVSFSLSHPQKPVPQIINKRTI